MENERRVYRRGTHVECEGRISVDSRNWIDIKANNISSGGMSFKSKIIFAKDDALYCKLTVNHLLTSFSFECNGIIASVQNLASGNLYGVRFVDVDKDMKIRIDENISAITPITRGGYTQE